MNFYGKLRQRYNQGPSNREQFQSKVNVASKPPKHRKIEMREKKNAKKKVIVVGAGFGGLYAAWLLKQGGYDVEVLESSNEVGGRVKSNHDFSSGRVVEFGAEFIGVCHKNWIRLAKHFGLSLNSITTEDNYSSMNLDSRFVFKDRILSGKELEKLYDQIGKVYEIISEDANQVKFPHSPWLDSKEVQELDKVSLGDKINEWKQKGIISEDAKEIISYMFENDNVSSVSQQSYLGLLCQVKGGSEAIDVSTSDFWDTVENFRCAEGNDALAHKLKEGVEKVHLNSFVDKINFGEKVTIKTRSGQKFVCDLVILAVAPTVFKDITFKPSLNLEDYSPGMGDAMKVFNSVNSRFWIKEGLSPSNYNCNLGQTWESTEGQSISKNQKLVLSIFTGGPHVKLVDPKVNPKAVKYIREQINKTFGISNFDSICDKTEFSLHHRDDFIHTGYSYGQVGKLKVSENLNKPAFDNKLYFVGEASSVEFTGYMEGALRSAYLTVKQIMGLVSSKKKSVPHEKKN